MADILWRETPTASLSLAELQRDGLRVSLPDAPATPRPEGPEKPGYRAEPLSGKRFMRRYRLAAVLLDATALGVATLVACLLRFTGAPLVFYAFISVMLLPVWLAIVSSQRGYEHRFLGTGPEEYRRILNSGLILVAALAIASYAVNFDLSRQYVLVTAPLTIAGALLGRNLLRRRIYNMRLRGHGVQRVLVVGQIDAAVATVDLLHREPQHGLAAVGLCVPRTEVHVSHLHEVPVVGGMDDVVEAVERVGADVVAVVSHPELSGLALRRLSWALEERNVDLVVSPGIIEVAGPRLSIRPVAGLSLLHLDHPQVSGGHLLLKSAMDRVAAAGILLLISPLLVAVGLAVRLTSTGPALYRQTRVGVGGTTFTMLKFRSMVQNADALRDALMAQSEGNGVLFKMRNDPRVTRVGAFIRRYSIDELPQLWNVVRGDMSLVGPRPPLPEEVELYDDDATRRLRVRPGLTGLWQVSGRSDLDWEESLRLDLRYVDNWSWALDLSILWRTFNAILGRAGAY